MNGPGIFQELTRFASQATTDGLLYTADALRRNSLLLLLSLLNVQTTAILLLSLHYSAPEFQYASIFILQAVFAYSIIIGFQRSTAPDRSSYPWLERLLRISGALFLFSVLLVFSVRVLLVLPGLYYWIIASIFIYFLFWYAYPRNRIYTAGLVLYLVFLSSPYQIKLIHILSPNVLILGWLFLYHIVDRWRRGIRTWSLHWRLIPALLTVVVLVIATHGSFCTHRSLIAMVNITCDLLFLLLLAEYLKTDSGRLHILIPIAASTVLTASVGLVILAVRCHALGLTAGLTHALWVNRCPPTTTAFQIVVLAPFLLAFREIYFMSYWRRVLPPALFIMMVFLYGTHSYTHWVILAIELTIYWFLFKRLPMGSSSIYRGRRRGLVLPAAGLALTAYPLGRTIQELLWAGWSDRCAFWSTIARTIPEHMWFGTGFNLKQYLYPALAARQPFQPLIRELTIDAENTWLEIYTSMGLAGVLCTIVLLLVASRRLGTMLRNPNSSSPIICATAAAFTGILLDSLSDFRLLSADTSIFIWVVLGIAMWNPIHQSRLDAALPTRTTALAARRMVDFVVTLGFALILSITLSLGLSRSFFQIAIQEVSSIPYQDSQTHFKLARQHLATALYYNGLDPHLHYYKGYANERAGRIKEAIADYREAVTLNPRNEYYYQEISKNLLRFGDRAGAAEMLDRALRLNPNREDALLYLGRAVVSHFEGDDTAMRQALLDGMGVNPHILLKLKQLHLRHPDFPAPVDILTQAVTDLEQAQHMEDGIRDRLAYSYCRAALLLMVANPSYRLPSLRYLAEQSLACLSTGERNGVCAAILRSRIYGLNDLECSQTILQKVLQRYPKHPVVENEMGLLLYIHGQYALSMKYLDAAMLHWNSKVVDNILYYAVAGMELEILDNPEAARLNRNRYLYVERDFVHQLWEAQQLFSKDEDKLQQIIYYHDLLPAQTARIIRFRILLPEFIEDY
ncbi:tetratricopeptide repeat protein [bacterium]|nr:tetratricopeptide repeat protein [candidate division CSSED10-310 bacterium]